MDVEINVTFLLRCILVTLLVILIYKWYKKLLPFISAVDKIPGPPKWPIIGNALDFLYPPDELFAGAMNELPKLGPVIRLWVLFDAVIVLSRARDVEKILQGMAHNVKGVNYNMLKDWMGEGLLTSKDEKWRVHRKVLTPAFHFNILHEFLPIFNKHALQMTKCLAAEPLAEHPRGFNIFQYTSSCSLDIICESSMGIEIHAQDNPNSEYVKSTAKMNDLLVRRTFSAWLRPEWMFQLSPTKREIDKHLQILNNFTDKVIVERRKYLKNIQPISLNVENDGLGKRRSLAFLDLLLAAEEEGLQYMSHKDIRDQVSTFMFEGHDTVSTAMCWLLFFLGLYTEHQDRIVEELVEVFGDSGRTPDMSDLANLKYLERCIKESLRLYPSVPFFERMLYQPLKLDTEGYVIPPGCSVTINNTLLHRDPEFWPEPEKFDPDRFLPENAKGRHPYAYIPFSAGPRNCIGQKFALLEEKAVLSTILRRFRVEAAHTLEEAKPQIGIVQRPKGGLRIRLYDRNTHPNLQVKE